MMNNVLKNQIGDIVKVYMDDMIVKYKEQEEHAFYLKSIFGEVRKYGMRLNPKK